MAGLRMSSALCMGGSICFVHPNLRCMCLHNIINLYCIFTISCQSVIIFYRINSRVTHGHALGRASSKRKGDTMYKRSCMTGIWCLSFMGMLLLLWACSPAIDTQASKETKTTEADMNLAYTIKTDTPEIPPIVAAAPAIFETASFGLG